MNKLDKFMKKNSGKLTILAAVIMLALFALDYYLNLYFQN